MEEGVETLEADLPALIAVSREINQPRFPTLIQIMSAGKKEIVEWNAQALGIETTSAGKAGSKALVTGLRFPKSTRKKILFEGKPEDAAKQLADALVREGVAK
jgi:electron transfer flavoprotein beta subunit